MDEAAQDTAQGPGKPFLSSSEVVERLGISKATLYAYVSRGLIRSEPVPDAPRTRRYRADDVERLLHRQRMRSDPESGTVKALDWGAPVLESEVSMISDRRLYYRGGRGRSTRPRVELRAGDVATLARGPQRTATRAVRACGEGTS